MYHVACEMPEGCCPRAAAILEEAEPDALAHLDFPQGHWKRLRTNDVRERANREMRRRSRVVRVFPSAASLERLAGAVMCEQDDLWADSRYFSEAGMRELLEAKAEAGGGARDEAGLPEFARRALSASLELADKMEADKIRDVVSVCGEAAPFRAGPYTNFLDTTTLFRPSKFWGAVQLF